MRPANPRPIAGYVVRYRCGRCSGIRTGDQWRGSKRLKPWGIVCPECVAGMAAKTAAPAAQPRSAP